MIFYVIHTPPSFRMDKDNYDVRGPQIKLKLIPPFDIKAVPSKIEWSKAGENVKYEIFIYHNGVQLWSAETKENFKVLPEEVKRRMTSGEKYSCKVMALSSQEIPVASGEIEFKIQRTK